VDTGDALLRLQRALLLAVRFDAFGQYVTRSDATGVSGDVQTPWVIKPLSGPLSRGRRGPPGVPGLAIRSSMRYIAALCIGTGTVAVAGA
jgi:hypothetical protein